MQIHGRHFVEQWRLDRARREALNAEISQGGTTEDENNAGDDGNTSDVTERDHDSDEENVLLVPSAPQTAFATQAQSSRPLVGWQTELAWHIESQLSEVSSSSLFSSSSIANAHGNDSTGFGSEGRVQEQVQPETENGIEVLAGPRTSQESHSSLFSDGDAVESS